MNPKTFDKILTYLLLVTILGFQVLMMGRQMFLLDMQLFEAKALMNCIEKTQEGG